MLIDDGAVLAGGEMTSSIYRFYLSQVRPVEQQQVPCVKLLCILSTRSICVCSWENRLENKF